MISPRGRAAASPRLHGVRYVGGHPGCVEVNRGGLPLRPRATFDPWAFDVILEDAAGLPASGADSNNCAGHVPAIIARLPVCSAPSECAVDLYPSDSLPWRRGGSPLPFPSGGTLWVRGSRVSLTGRRMGPRPARVGRRRDGQPARVRARASSSIFRGQCGRVLCPWYSALANLVVVVGGADAATVNVRHLSPRSRSGGYCLDDVFVDWVSFLLLRFFSCGFSRFFSRFFSCGFLSRFPLYLLGVWCSVLPRTKSAERIVPTRHPSGGRLTLSSCCWRWRHQ